MAEGPSEEENPPGSSSTTEQKRYSNSFETYILYGLIVVRYQNFPKSALLQVLIWNFFEP